MSKNKLLLLLFIVVPLAAERHRGTIRTRRRPLLSVSGGRDNDDSSSYALPMSDQIALATSTQRWMPHKVTSQSQLSAFEDTEPNNHHFNRLSRPSDESLRTLDFAATQSLANSVSAQDYVAKALHINGGGHSPVRDKKTTSFMNFDSYENPNHHQAEPPVPQYATNQHQSSSSSSYKPTYAQFGVQDLSKGYEIVQNVISIRKPTHDMQFTNFDEPKPHLFRPTSIPLNRPTVRSTQQPPTPSPTPLFSFRQTIAAPAQHHSAVDQTTALSNAQQFQRVQLIPKSELKRQIEETVVRYMEALAERDRQAQKQKHMQEMAVEQFLDTIERPTESPRDEQPVFYRTKSQKRRPTGNSVDLTLTGRSRQKPLDLATLDVGQTWSHDTPFDHSAAMKTTLPFGVSDSAMPTVPVTPRPRLHFSLQTYHDINALPQSNSVEPGQRSPYRGKSMAFPSPAPKQPMNSVRILDGLANVGASITVGSEHRPEHGRQIESTTSPGSPYTVDVNVLKYLLDGVAQSYAQQHLPTPSTTAQPFRAHQNQQAPYDHQYHHEQFNHQFDQQFAKPTAISVQLQQQQQQSTYETHNQNYYAPAPQRPTDMSYRSQMQSPTPTVPHHHWHQPNSIAASTTTARPQFGGRPWDSYDPKYNNNPIGHGYQEAFRVPIAYDASSVQESYASPGDAYGSATTARPHGKSRGKRGGGMKKNNKTGLVTELKPPPKYFLH